MIQEPELKFRHCERSEAIQMLGIHGLLRFARNDKLKMEVGMFRWNEYRRTRRISNDGFGFNFNLNQREKNRNLSWHF